MALSTVGQFNRADVFLQVLLLDVGRLVLVAIEAGIPGIGGSVASGAGNVAFSAMIQREGVLHQTSRLPGLGRVAVGTIGSKQSGVNSWFGVAGYTLRRPSFKFTPGMATSAGSFQMGACEGKDLSVVFDGETGHSVKAIMAGEAVGAIGICMQRHERWIGLTMAAGAGGQDRREVALLEMAGDTGHWLFRVIMLVPDQAELG